MPPNFALAIVDSRQRYSVFVLRNVLLKSLISCNLLVVYSLLDMSLALIPEALKACYIVGVLTFKKFSSDLAG